MIVCHCHRVCDRTIRALTRQGVCTVREIGLQCGAGTGCGGCREALVEIVEREQLIPLQSLASPEERVHDRRETS